MVGELTTSEAIDVLAQVNIDRRSSAEGQHKSEPGSSGKAESDPGSGSENQNNSGSSNAKSREKSIPSEGVSTGAPSKDLDKPTADEHATNAMVDDASGMANENHDVEMGTSIKEFLEPSGTRMKAVEGLGLESLLRKAFMYLPEERQSPLELAKHRWFHDEFMDPIVE